MSLWLQHLLVLLVLAGAVGFVAWQVVRGLWGKSSKVGSCCASGCGSSTQQRPQQDTASNKPVVFIPSDSLLRRHQEHLKNSP